MPRRVLYQLIYTLALRRLQLRDQSVRTAHLGEYATLTCTVLVFHAGGFVLGSSAMVPEMQITHLIAKGFVVAVPEYRLCPQVSLYEGPIQDAKDVLKWCQEELPGLIKAAKDIDVDALRIGAMGHSAGGLLALTTVGYVSAGSASAIANLHRVSAPTHRAPLSTSMAASISLIHGGHRNWRRLRSCQINRRNLPMRFLTVSRRLRHFPCLSKGNQSSPIRVVHGTSSR